MPAEAKDSATREIGAQARIELSPSQCCKLWRRADVQRGIVAEREEREEHNGDRSLRKQADGQLLGVVVGLAWEGE